MAILVIAATTAVVPSLASAAMILPELTVETNGSATSGAGAMLAVVTVKCTSDKITFIDTSKKGGAFVRTCEGATALGEECHTLGDAVKIILEQGMYFHVLVSPGGVDRRLILFEPKPTHLECKALGMLTSYQGTVLGSLSGAGKTKTFTIKVSAKGAKEQEFKEYENAEGKIVKTQLLASVNEGAFEEAADEWGEEHETTEKETEMID
jgi:hypothetical protein